MRTNKKIKPFWTNYTNWECYKNNMYDDRLDLDNVERCFLLLTDTDDCYNSMKKVTEKYPIGTRVTFTNQMFNPASWLGQAMCNLEYDATARETCNAWLMMNREQQETANKIAEEIILEWRKNYESI